ncbi:MAG: hypothetical protein ACRBCL_03720 [Maritimibacter sp.]
MNRKILALGLGICLVSPLASGAFAQGSNCANRDLVLSRLAEKYGESAQAIGMAQGNQVVEMYASPETGSWTLTVTLPSGQTCIIAAGTSFERLEGATPAKGTPV